MQFNLILVVELHKGAVVIKLHSPMHFIRVYLNFSYFILLIYDLQIHYISLILFNILV